MLTRRMLEFVVAVMFLQMFTLLTVPVLAETGVEITDSSLPPVVGRWEQWPPDATARYAATLASRGETFEGEVWLQHVNLRDVRNVVRTVDGSDEILQFEQTIETHIPYLRLVMGSYVGELNGISLEDIAMVRIRVLGKGGKTTGTFPLLLENFFVAIKGTDAAGNEKDMVLIRNVPGMASTGSITVTDRGAGDYRFTGYLDAFTEGSVVEISDEYVRDQNGPVRLVLLSAGLTERRICGTVFRDNDGDGVRGSDEPGISNVTLQLTGAGVNALTKSDGNGYYCFGRWDDEGYGYAAGEYSVSIDMNDPYLPSGAILTTGGNPATLTIAADDPTRMLDFGFKLARAPFQVNSTEDEVDIAPGNGKCLTGVGTCTLRAAIQEANALAGGDTIMLPAGTYTLDISGAGDNASVKGDLDITQPLTIIGAGHRETVINGNASVTGDRVFHVIGTAGTPRVAVAGIAVTGGGAPDSFGGGGVANVGGTLVLADVTVSDNQGGQYGGGIANGTGATVVLRDVTVTENYAGEGGGMHNRGTATLSRVMFDRNESHGTGSPGGGGGIFNSGSVTLENASLYGNTDHGYGGGALFNAGTALLLNTTLAGNSASTNRKGGGVYTESGHVTTLKNSIVSGNSQGDCCAGAAIASSGHNVADDASCNLSGTGDRNSTNPLLLPPGDNGGAVQTLALSRSPVSPAINGADPSGAPATDARGVLRKSPDIGSYEVDGKVLDLSVEQSVAAGPVYAGANLSYSIRITNNSAVTANDVIFTDALPAGAAFVAVYQTKETLWDDFFCSLEGSNLTCLMDYLDPGEWTEVRLIVAVPSTASMTNVARIRSSAPEFIYTNNVSSLTTGITTTTSAADLFVAQGASPTPAVAGGTLTYTVTVGNSGPVAVTDAVLTDVLPPQVEYLSAGIIGAGGSCSFRESGLSFERFKVVSCSMGAIASGASKQVSIRVIPQDPFRIANKAMVTSSIPDPNRANNSSTLYTAVSPTDLSVTQSVSPSSGELGAPLIYTITITNKGTNPALYVDLIDTLPDTVQINSLTSSDSCLWGAVTARCFFLGINPGATETVTLVVTPTGGPSIFNSVEVVSETPDLNPANNISTVTTPVITAPNARLIIPGSGPAPYLTLTSAYSNAPISPVSSLIQGRARMFTETFVLNQDKKITFSGGYDPTYKNQIGESVVNGSVTIGQGMLAVDRITIR